MKFLCQTFLVHTQYPQKGSQRDQMSGKKSVVINLSRYARSPEICFIPLFMNNSFRDLVFPRKASRQRLRRENNGSIAINYVKRSQILIN